MKLILNNKDQEPIGIDSFGRSLNIPNSSILFNVYFSTNDAENMASMNSLAQYTYEPITSYKLVRDNGVVAAEVNNIVAHLTNFNENFYDNAYNANASMDIEEIHVEPEIEED